MRSAASSTSPIASSRLLPFSQANAAPSTTERSEIRSAARSSRSQRRSHGVVAQADRAARAVATTSSTSSPSAWVKCPISTDVSIGETVVNVSPKRSSSPIQSRVRRTELGTHLLDCSGIRRLQVGVVGGQGCVRDAECGHVANSATPSTTNARRHNAIDGSNVRQRQLTGAGEMPRRCGLNS